MALDKIENSLLAAQPLDSHFLLCFSGLHYHGALQKKSEPQRKRKWCAPPLNLFKVAWSINQKRNLDEFWLVMPSEESSTPTSPATASCTYHQPISLPLWSTKIIYCHATRNYTFNLYWLAEWKF